MGRLDGKVAFITGAARGQGRSHALRMAEEGADIIAVDLCADIGTVHYPMPTIEDLDETARLVRKADRRIVAVQADVRDQEALRNAFHAGVDELGRVDIVCANAGIAPMDADEPDPVQICRDVIDVNLIGVWNTVRVAAPAMIDAGQGGAIVLTSSTGGLKGFGGALLNAGVESYAAAKHGVVGLMRAFANEFAKHSIRVNSVHPTGVNTPMITNDAVARLMDANAEMAEVFRHPMPVSTIESIDVTNAVVWLVSDEARYVTGVALPVDAGLTNK